jgi:hypothetical protein
MSVAAQSNMILILAWMSTAAGNHSLLPAKDEMLDGETAYGIVAWLLLYPETGLGINLGP